MIKKIKHILILGALLIPSLFIGQKKSDLLKRQEKKLLEKIEHTKDLINQTRATKNLPLVKLILLTNKFSTGKS